MIKKISISTVLVCMLMYGAFAFVLWDFDPLAWGAGGRLFFVILTLAAATAAAAAIAGGTHDPQ